MPIINFNIALFIAFGGLAYHMVFILNPSDLHNRRTPAVIAIASWAILGMAGGIVIPTTYVLWNNYVMTCMIGMVLILGGATLGHVVLGISRSCDQAEASYIAMEILKERDEQ